jgi:hypothetical protein
VFFDALGVTWTYEPEGYRLPSGGYLPDFWLESVGMWAEVKGQRMNAREEQKAIDLAKATGREVLLLEGVPSPVAYAAIVNGASRFPSFPGWRRMDDWYFLNDKHLIDRRWYVQPEYGWHGVEEWNYLSARAVAAYEAARSARFEWGQTPAGGLR